MDNFDDYDDNFDGDDFMDDSFEDTFDENFEPEDLADDGTGIEEEQSDEICEDEFTMEDAVMTGIAYGWGFEDGLEEAKRRRFKRKLDKGNDDSESNNL